MKENKPELKTKNKKKKYISNDGLYLQAILSACTILLTIMSQFVKEFSTSLGVILSMLLFTMAYNNQTSYAKENRTMIYVILGFLTLGMTILGLFL